MQSLGTIESVGPVNLEVVDGQVSIPDPQILVDGDYSRSGQHLVLEGEDGASLNVLEYFSTSPLPNLVSSDGQSINGETVALMAGPNAPGQYAQAGGPSGATPIGQVETLSGGAVSQRTDGVEVNLSVGAHVFQGDVLKVDAGGSLGITFADETVMSLEDGAKIVLNEMVYSPSGSDNSMLFSLVQGAASFVTGAVPKTGDMEISTPVAVMAIRGTTFAWICPGASFCDALVKEGGVNIRYGEGKQVDVDADGTITKILSSGSASQRSSNGQFDSVFEKLQQVVDSFQSRQSEGDEPVEIKKTGGPNGVKETDLGERLKSDDDSGTETAAAFVTPLVEATAREEAVEEDGEVTPSHLNAAPVVFEDLFLRVSEEGLPGSYPDEIGEADTTNAASVVGQLNVVDGENDALTFLFTDPSIVGTTADGSEFPLTSGGVEIVWDGVGTGTIVGTAGGVTVVTATVSETGWVEVYLEGPIDHPDALIEDEITLNFPISVDDGLNDPVIVELNVTIEDDFVDPSVLSLDGLELAIDESPGLQQDDLNPAGAPAELASLGDIKAFTSTNAPQVMAEDGTVFGADGDDGTVDFSFVDSSGETFSSTEGVATNLYVTAGSPRIPENQIYLFSDSSNPNLLYGKVGGVDGEIAFAIFIEPVDAITAKISVAEYMAIEGVVDGSTVSALDEVLGLTTESGANLVYYEGLVTDPDADFTVVLSGSPLELSFYDDGPSFDPNTVTVPVLTTDDTDISTSSDTKSFVGLFTPDFGTDDFKDSDDNDVEDADAVTYALSLSDDAGVDSGLIDTLSGDKIYLFMDGDDVVGLVGLDDDGGADAFGDVAFTISVGANSGDVTLLQDNSISHPADAAVVFSGSDKVNLTATITDGDGDTATNTVDITGGFAFDDDILPSFDPNTVAVPVLTTDDTDISTSSDTKSFVGLFTPDFGTDDFKDSDDNDVEDADAVTYALSLSDDAGVDSGLIDTLSGDKIYLFMDGDDVVGLVGLDDDGGADAFGDVAFTISVGANSGDVTLLQDNSISHPADAAVVFSGSDKVNLTATITDGDGDTATNTVDITGGFAFDDDILPSFDPNTVAVPVLTTDDTDISTSSDTKSFVGLFTPDFGTDDFKDSDDNDVEDADAVTYALSLSDDAGVDSGLIDTLSGDKIYLFMDGDDVVGLVGLDDDGGADAFGDVAFTISVGANSGDVTLLQDNSISHPADAAVVFSGSDKVNLTATITDGDGDTATNTVDITGGFAFDDDILPSFDPNTVAVPVLTTDDTDISTSSDTKSFVGLFTPDFGTDDFKDSDDNDVEDADAVTYALSLSDDAGVDSGLIDTLSGDKIYLFMDGDDVVGLVGLDDDGGADAFGDVAFTISVGANSGDVTLLQDNSISHPADAAVVFSGSDKVNLTATITDGDGDTATNTVDITGGFAFDDDILPSFDPNTVAVPVLTTDDTDISTSSDTKSFVGLFTPDFGTDDFKDSDDNDVEDADAVTYALSLSDDAGVDSGLIDTLSGDKIYLFMDGDDVVGLVGLDDDGGADAFGDVAFTISVGANSGDVTLLQDNSISHPADAAVVFSGSDKVNLTATITDGDGDTATNTVDITGGFAFDDDILPSFDPNTVAVPVLTTDDTDISTSSDTKSFVGLFTPDFGTDDFKDSDDNDVEDADAVTYALSLSDDAGVDSGLIDTLSGDKIYLFMDGDDVVGLVGLDDDGGADAFGDVAFTISVGANSGDVTLLQDNSISHPADAAVVFSGSDKVNLTATITDGDGDTATNTVDITGGFAFDDDILPSFDPNTVAVPVLTTDDTDISTSSDTKSFVGLFTPDFGTDDFKDSDDNDVEDADAVTYALSLSDDAGVDSGLIDTLSGDKIYLFMDGDDVVGLVGLDDDGGADAFGDVAFTISVGANSGDVTLLQDNSISHPADAAVVFSGSDKVNLTATITDGDGDTATNTVDITGGFAFDDDEPANAAGSVTAVVSEDALDNLSGVNGSQGNLEAEANQTTIAYITGLSLAALVDFGADGAAAFSLNESITGSTGLASKGEDVVFSSDGTTITGAADGRTVFTVVEVASSDAEYVQAVADEVIADGDQLFKFTLEDQIDNAPETGVGDEGSDPIDISGAFVAADNDGDTVILDAGSVIVNIENDVPLIEAETSAEISVQEDALGQSTGNSDNNDDADNELVGNSDNEGETDSATFSANDLQALVSPGADEEVVFSLKDVGDNTTAVVDTNDAPVTSNGEAVTYEYIGENTINGVADHGGDNERIVFTLTRNVGDDGETGTADDTFTFNLDDQLDHVEDLDDLAVLNVDLTAAFGAADEDGDPVDLSSGGLITVNVENDISSGLEFETSSFGGVRGSGAEKILPVDEDNDINLVLTPLDPANTVNNTATVIGVNRPGGGGPGGGGDDPNAVDGIPAGEGLRADLLSQSDATESHVSMKLFQATISGVSSEFGATVLVKAVLANDDDDVTNDPTVPLVTSDFSVMRDGVQATGIDIYEVDDGMLIVTGIQDGDIIVIQATTDDILGTANFNRVELQNVGTSGEEEVPASLLSDFDSNVDSGDPTSEDYEGDNVLLLGGTFAFGGFGLNTAYQSIAEGDPETADTDALAGTFGDDLLIAAAGVDEMTGGGGDDVFKIVDASLSESFTDVIIDYDNYGESDVIDLTELFVVDPDGDASMDELLDFVQIVDAGDEINLDNVKLQIDMDGSDEVDWVDAAILDGGSGVSVLYNHDGEVELTTLYMVS